MKQDPYFKYLAVIVLAGLVTAVVDATPAAPAQPEKAPTVVTAASHNPNAKG